MPYDEINVGKPWCGEVGFYVDDRAVRPDEFLSLDTNELLNLSRGSFFAPDKIYRRRGNAQSWGVLDVRFDATGLVDESIQRSLRQLREVEGMRTLLILPADYAPIPGLDEELLRLGARWTRFDANAPEVTALQNCLRELVIDNLASYDSEINPIELGRPDELVLSSRHFNRVVERDGLVYKTSDDERALSKLRAEYAWLKHARSLPELANVVPDEVIERGNGYATTAYGSSVAQVLLRSALTYAELVEHAERLAMIWSALSSLPTRTAGPTEHVEYVREFYVDKSHDRLGELERVLEEVGMADVVYAPWVVNGTQLPSPWVARKKLLELVAERVTPEQWGVVHGDLCPGNVVTSSDGSARLIDPRGDFYGDRTYDLSKLAHALFYGYDALVAGWRDCTWRREGVEEDAPLVVDLRVWDEDTPEWVPNRRIVWNELVNRELSAGTVGLNDPVVHAVAALQLITCAPLHREDTERVIALVARGLQAAAGLVG